MGTQIRAPHVPQTPAVVGEAVSVQGTVGLAPREGTCRTAERPPQLPPAPPHTRPQTRMAWPRPTIWATMQSSDDWVRQHHPWACGFGVRPGKGGPDVVPAPHIVQHTHQPTAAQQALGRRIVPIPGVLEPGQRPSHPFLGPCTWTGAIMPVPGALQPGQ